MLQKQIIQKTTAEKREAIRRSSAYSLPDNPSARGMKPDEIKRAFWAPILSQSESYLNEMDRIVDEINAYFDAFFSQIGEGDVERINEAYKEFEREGETGLTKLGNVVYRILIDHLDSKNAHSDIRNTLKSIGTAFTIHQNASNAHQDIRDTIEENKTIADDRDKEYRDSLESLFQKGNKNAEDISIERDRINEVKDEIGAGSLQAGETLKQGINEAYRVGYRGDLRSQQNQVAIVGITARVDGIARSFVLDTFYDFADFMRGEKSIRIKEDRDGDRVSEEIDLYAKDLVTGDNLLIVELGVPDFWFEKNENTENTEQYTYKGVTYDLLAIDNDNPVGLFHIAETDYSVIAGHATSAAISASEAKEAARTAELFKTGAEDAAKSAAEENTSAQKSASNAAKSARDAELTLETVMGLVPKFSRVENEALHTLLIEVDEETLYIPASVIDGETLILKL